MRQAISEFLSSDFTKIKTPDQMSELKRRLAKKYRDAILLHSDLLPEIKKRLKNKNLSAKERINLESAVLLLKKRAIRTLSGIAPVAVLTKPYPCPGHCAYCPNEPDVPASYLSNEPAVMRAIRCQYDPYRQIVLRLKAMENNGHEPNKIEVIVIGGTWSYFPTKYKFWYILNCFRAANDYAKLKLPEDPNEDSRLKLADNLIKKIKSPYKQNLSLIDLKKKLLAEQNKNTKAKYKIIGLTLETRPDYINDAELLEMRQLGATRVEIGVQAVDDQILKLNNRGSGIKEIAQATKLLKDYGFKVTYHFMPALPGSTPKRDLEMFKKLFSNQNYQPDQIKFYPTVVTKGSLLYRWYKQGKYQPYTDKELEDLIADCKAIVPPYVRIIRLIRDIPRESIVAGNLVTNLRQVMQQRGVKCNCLRCREIKDKPMDIKKAKLSIIEYPASDGKEYFLSYNSPDQKDLYGFCRLRLTNNSKVAPAIIRELHVYGLLVPVGHIKKVQHSGLGKKLMRKAEKIAQKNKAKTIAVISGIGVRGYYQKLGYKLKDTYMKKAL
ncbi:tRNA uridine(34) 5-carboxymethylaminomethyl modification radical SAM/GNAT enzyme Elp3 [Candidatus Falkowbacteria bacterium CG_4_10_14_0_2_um_filter_41_15]|uniref:tRNA carboxymethyluridine synthase n=3 Tax=Candidatus Falkowiibacteriota TaxID=1752728 RepID=A0A2G9ZMV3_9BACT|nr:MAG: tRNA uridine(34) 5-carboxymethylaminomethyl modification radical SAM/GNAT enzyme Elp3 [Candidatus Falkowbacteria bacterium CG23_combo_of_CG06-09_8_20_14_all_41_10]PIZ11354.1 MAG: tRNA uridine(34) 5-carboxymethylaminomethyl modification radical SAM/GNAT enzyme Elp3 [Candidatus Falkowbacteria bacterium CG_4_10_14_0_8_um_filter_41_36]PJA09980.1 MAG: tRNA uridine(34) 5-carboxymethylaminomethyl modification radical SAM/GNAT enzyme Elp3 [Candidatus Falkowbacteria bacterium CG_4_10_14_0_2_um_fil